jgi:hypothetical protein
LQFVFNILRIILGGGNPVASHTFKPTWNGVSSTTQPMSETNVEDVKRVADAISQC